MADQPQKDTIPRLHRLVPHMQAFLRRMDENGLTFEEARRGYADTVAALAASGHGRRTVNRVADEDAYWSPTAEVLDEAMRLGFVPRQPFPSARRHVDAYRSTVYALTDDGREIASLADEDFAEFVDRLTAAALHAHPYLRAFLLSLDEGPLVSPEIREGDLERGRRTERDTSYWASWATERINAGWPNPIVSPEAVREEMVHATKRRFGAHPVDRPTNKAVAEALNDAFWTASLRARNLPFGATDLKVLKAWGSQLLLLDESRYVPAFAGSNVIWLASDVRLDGDRLVARRRTYDNHGEAVARALVVAYERQADPKRTDQIKMPYLPIHEVRAEAAYETGVTRQLADLVLERLALGEFPDLNVSVWLHISGDEVPSSEPIYRRGGNRRVTITMQTTGGELS